MSRSDSTKTGRLKSLGNVEGLPAELETLGGRAGEQERVFGVTMPHETGEQDVALRRAGRQSRSRTHALDVPDDDRHLDEERQPDILGHQRQAGAGGGGHRAGAHPSGADGDPGPGDFVLRLNDGDGQLARLRVGAQRRGILLDRLGQAGGRGNRVPADDTDASVERAEGGGGVPVDHDLAFGLIVALHDVGILFDQVLTRPCGGGLDHGHVALDRLGLAVEVRLEGAAHFGQVDAQHLGDDADVGHVGHVVAQRLGRVQFAQQFLDRDGVEGDVLAGAGGGDGVVVEAHAARAQARQILDEGRRIHGHQDLGALAACGEPVRAGADREPGGQSLDVGREQVLPADGDAHAEQGAQDGHI